jgi:hypothetical protein
MSRLANTCFSLRFSSACFAALTFSAADLSTANCLQAAAAEVKAAPAATAKPHARRVFKSVDEVLNLYGEAVRAKLKPIFSARGVSYPPKDMTWVCLKQEKMLLLFAKDAHAKQKQLFCYPIIGSSGASGPKLKEGDMQVPEGFYRIANFHPNVIAHMALDVNYPNEEDKAHAIAEHRKKLGCDILIHGSRWSSGCLAMGNQPIEEMFVLAYDCGLKNISLIFAPCNLITQKPGIDFKKQPTWLPQLYKRISAALQEFPIDTSKVIPAETLSETQARF